MTTRSLFGACAGGLVGALVWAAIVYFTESQIGWVAVGVGAAVGVASIALGGSGSGNAFACACVAVGAILVGKLIVASLIKSDALDSIMQEAWEEQSVDAIAFAALESEDDYPRFMVDHGYSDASRPSKVSDEELADFAENTAPALLKLTEDDASAFEEWRDENREDVEAMLDLFLEAEDIRFFGPADAFFALIGMAVAFLIGRGSGVA